MSNVRRTPAGSWKGEYRDDAGRKVSKTFKLRGDARRWAEGQEQGLLRGDHIYPGAGNVLLSEWALEWMASAHNLAPSTRSRYEVALRTHLLPEFGAVRLNRIMERSVQGWVNKLKASGLAPASVRKSFNLLRVMLRAAANVRLIPRSPCEETRLPKVETREMMFLTAEQLHQLAEGVENRFWALLMTAGYAGPRWSELAALRVGDLRLLERRLTVQRYRGGRWSVPRRAVEDGEQPSNDQLASIHR